MVRLIVHQETAMNSINLSDPSDMPLPPQRVRLLDVSAEPFPDGRRVALNVIFTPFQEPPSAEIQVFDSQNQKTASAHIIETIETRTRITIHLPENRTAGRYTVRTRAYYVDFHLPEDDPQSYQSPASTPIGELVTVFDIP